MRFVICILCQRLTGAIKSRRTRWTGYVALMGEMINAHRILAGKFEGKGSFQKSGVGLNEG